MAYRAKGRWGAVLGQADAGSGSQPGLQRLSVRTLGAILAPIGLGGAIGGVVVALPPMFAAGIAGASAVAWAMFTWYNVAIGLTLFLLPIIPKTLGPTLMSGGLFLSVGRGILLLMAFVAVLKLARGVRLPFYPRRLALCLVVGGLLMLPSVVASADVKTSALSFFSLNVEYYLVFWLVTGWVTNMGRGRTVATILVLSGALIAVLGLAEFGTGIRIADYLPENGVEQVEADELRRLGMGRVSSTLPHPIFLGATMAMLTPLAVSLALEARSLLVRTGTLGASVLMVACLMLTLSRGAMLALALGMVVLLAFVARRQPRYLWLPYVLVLGAVIAIPFAPSVLETLGSLFGGLFARTGAEESMAVTYRLVLLDVALQALARRPLTGYGLNMFGEAGLVGHWGSGIRMQLESADNYFVMVMVESGWTGLIGYSLVMVAVLIVAWQMVRLAKDGESRSMAAALLGALLGFVFLNATVGAYRVVQNGYVFWALAGLLMSLGRLSLERRAARSTTPVVECPPPDDLARARGEIEEVA